MWLNIISFDGKCIITEAAFVATGWDAASFNWKPVWNGLKLKMGTAVVKKKKTEKVFFDEHQTVFFSSLTIIEYLEFIIFAFYFEKLKLLNYCEYKYENCT